MSGTNSFILDYFKTTKIEFPHKEPILFFDHHDGPPTYCTLSKGKPDILAIYGKKETLKPYRKRGQSAVYSGVPCYHLVTVVECKPGTKPGDAQAMRYTEQLLEARPDMSGVYGLCANAEKYLK